MELYRNEQMEQELQRKIGTIAAARCGDTVPADAVDRIATETQHIIGSGYGTMLAAVAKLAEFSEDHGYPVGIRGLIGNLYVSHLLGIASLDPMTLGLRWESCLGLDGNRAPEITLNVAAELLEDIKAYLGEILPECDIVHGLPGMAPSKVIVVPKASGEYDPSREYFAIDLCPHKLMGLVGQARQRSDPAWSPGARTFSPQN